MEPLYREFFGLDPRLTVWVVAELHLMFAAFVLGVPMFAVIVELVAAFSKDPATRKRFDGLAHEFTKLLSAAFATTAALGGLLTFVLFSCYPRFMSHLTQIFHPTYFVYALLFFGEGFTLYLYYYSWRRMQSRGAKAAHIGLGVLLNVFGTLLMLVANSWASYMMSPPGLEAQAAGPLETHWQGSLYTGSLKEAFFNTLWMPLNIHRVAANAAFGGAICAAYAAVKFLGAKSPEAKAQYDWMGYVGNFVAMSALIPLPFAGYYLGREVYSFNPTMGQDMMGGTFSWTFILQAVFVGTLFIGGNFYIWSGLKRIPGGERYEKFVPWMIAILFFCFAVWLTPHNLALGGAEKKFGLMPAKNAVIQLMILTTYFGFLMYRRANKGEPLPFSSHGRGGYLTVGVAALLSIYIVYLYASSASLADANPDYGKFRVGALSLGPLTFSAGERFTFAATLRWTLYHQMFWVAVCAALACLNRPKLAQGLLLSITAFHASMWLFQHGFTIMEKANPLVRHVAVAQVIMIFACLITSTALDLVWWKRAPSLGAIRWGHMHARSQFVLILVCTFFVMNMGLMGFIRSGLRKNWHVVAILKDTSQWATTPSNFTMAVMVTAISLAFLSLVAFVFWTASLVGKESAEVAQAPNHVTRS